MNQSYGEPMMNSDREQASDGLSISRIRLWFGALGGALMWLLHLVVAYLISEFGCVSWWGEQFWLGITVVAWAGLVLSVLMVIGTVLSHQVALANHKQVSVSNGALETDIEDGRRMLAHSGVVANRIFLFIIVVQTIPFLFYLQGC